MKRLFVLIVFTALLLPLNKANACDIHIKVDGEKTENFQVNDEIVIEVEVVYTHRRCHEGIGNTRFRYEGLEVLGATSWEETGNGKYVRKLKVKVIEGTETLQLQAVRRCHEEGGRGTIRLARA